LSNTLERLETSYADRYTFEMNAQKSGGLKITIRIPYEPMLPRLTVAPELVNR